MLRKLWEKFKTKRYSVVILLKN
ncbi:MAG: Unknown protein, partial [uncultured Thiotrichaceae bacterium]